MLNVIHAEPHKQTHYAECHYAKCHYAECHYAKCHYAECHYAKCHYAECRGAQNVDQGWYSQNYLPNSYSYFLCKGAWLQE